MKVRVHVTLKPGVLDPQGRATHHTLENMGFSGINDIRCGRMIDLDVDPSVSDETIADMCRKLLANTVIENYEVVRLEQQEPAT
ncbi:MAG: phosphoribosylformylglycinamidine synthase subunit PurS [Pseudomonadota bacterium]